jgi:tetratricopeptide (TPR) repeat protein
MGVVKSICWRILSVVTISSCIVFTAYSQSTQNRQLTQPDASAKPTAQLRLALIIGNSDYHNAPHLENPANDAEDMAKTLRSLGFDIVGDRAHVNQSAEKMKKLIAQFGEKLRGTNGVGLFYYAGHGVQANGHNYLVPVEAKILREPMLESEAVDVNRVLSEMDSAGNGLNVVILDACRSNPFGRGWRSSDNGLAAITAPEGTLIAYATSPGGLSDDGTGRNGLYTSQLLQVIPKRGLNVLEVFQQVRISVKKLSGGKQIPWEATSLTGNFYFAGTVNGVQVVRDPNQAEYDFWDSIKGSAKAEDFRRYLNEYPKGQYAPLARNNLRRIEDADVASKSPNNNGGNANVSPRSVAGENILKALTLRSSGDAHRMSGENDLAIKDFTEALRLYPNEAQTYALRALSFQSTGKLDLALIDLVQAIRIDNTFYWYFLLRGGIYHSKHEYDLALSDLNEAIRLSPTEYKSYEKRAEIYRAMGKNDLALLDENRQITDLSEKIRLNPNNSQAYLDRCDAYRMKGQIDLAFSDCNQAIRLDAKNGSAYATRGEMFRSRGNLDSGIADLTEAIRLNPTWPWSYERRAEAYRSARLTKLAEIDEQKVKELKGIH